MRAGRAGTKLTFAVRSGDSPRYSATFLCHSTFNLRHLFPDIRVIRLIRGLIFFENFAAPFPEKEIGRRRLRHKTRVASVLALVLA